MLFPSYFPRNNVTKGCRVTYLFGKPGKEVPSPKEIQNQIELAFSLKGCGRRYS